MNTRQGSPAISQIETQKSRWLKDPAARRALLTSLLDKGFLTSKGRLDWKKAVESDPTLKTRLGLDHKQHSAAIYHMASDVIRERQRADGTLPKIGTRKSAAWSSERQAVFQRKQQNGHRTEHMEQGQPVTHYCVKCGSATVEIAPGVSIFLDASKIDVRGFNTAMLATAFRIAEKHSQS